MSQTKITALYERLRHDDEFSQPVKANAQIERGESLNPCVLDNHNN